MIGTFFIILAIYLLGCLTGFYFACFFVAGQQADDEWWQNEQEVREDEEAGK